MPTELDKVGSIYYNKHGDNMKDIPLETLDIVNSSAMRLELIRALIVNRAHIKGSQRYKFTEDLETELLNLCEEQMDCICDTLLNLKEYK